MPGRITSVEDNQDSATRGRDIEPLRSVRTVRFFKFRNCSGDVRDSVRPLQEHLPLFAAIEFAPSHDYLA